MSRSQLILVTGGTGFIGSHTVVELISKGHEVLILDNFSNSKPEVLERLRRLTGQAIPFQEGDVRDRALLEKLFRERAIGTVIHFAGFKAVGESTQVPLAYYQNNLLSSLQLLETMKNNGCRRLVFSSSATVYGNPQSVPLKEDAPLQATNPYGRTKAMIEDFCRDLAASEEGWHIALLRYFNPVGGHPSGLLGEEPVGIPNNLMPFMMQVASGQRERLAIFGGDYPTPDGTGVRDYIHVLDLAKGHVAAVQHLEAIKGAVPINLGTGKGYSVLELVRTMSGVLQRPLPFHITARRPGDIASCYADVSLARQVLDWSADQGLEAMCRDAWAFTSRQGS